jgi:glycerol-3-phosphate dehydrogenase
MVQPSQGIHLVVDGSFLQSNDALMIPETPDGRVIFAVPWRDHLLLGTTDTPLQHHSLEPEAGEKEVQFILDTIKEYLSPAPTRKDVLSVFAGLRPLAATDDNTKATKEISRDHKLFTSPSGLITITGGKWTTYRKMAEEAVNTAIGVGQLPARGCITKAVKIQGSEETLPAFDNNITVIAGHPVLKIINETPSLAKKLVDHFPFTEAEVVWAVQAEMARTVEDVLARRLRILFLDAAAALQVAPRVASLMAAELGRDESWQEEQLARFTSLANQYLLTSRSATAKEYGKSLT